jgi:hypothetical protein
MQQKKLRKFLHLFYSLSIILIILISFSKTSYANIYGMECNNKKTSMSFVYSLKRKAIILRKGSASPVKVKFEIKKNTPTFFEAKGVYEDLKTTISFDMTKKEVTLLQASLQGKNIFMQCSDPVVLKKE